MAAANFDGVPIFPSTCVAPGTVVADATSKWLMVELPVKILGNAPKSFASSCSGTYINKLQMQLFLFVFNLAESLHTKYVYTEEVASVLYADDSEPVNNLRKPEAIRLHIFTSLSWEDIALKIEANMREGLVYQSSQVKTEMTDEERNKKRRRFIVDDKFPTLNAFANAVSPYPINNSTRLVLALSSTLAGIKDDQNWDIALDRVAVPLPAPTEDNLWDNAGEGEGVAPAVVDAGDTDEITVNASCPSRVLNPDDPLFPSKWLDAKHHFNLANYDPITFYSKYSHSQFTLLSIRRFSDQLVPNNYKDYEQNFKFPDWACEHNLVKCIRLDSTYPTWATFARSALPWITSGAVDAAYAQRQMMLDKPVAKQTPASTTSKLSVKTNDSVPMSVEDPLVKHKILYRDLQTFASKHDSQALWRRLLHAHVGGLMLDVLALDIEDSGSTQAHHDILNAILPSVSAAETSKNPIMRANFYNATIKWAGMDAISDFYLNSCVWAREMGQHQLGAIHMCWVLLGHAGNLDPLERVIIILYGPPGTGKTHLVRFISTHMLPPSAHVIVSGQSAKANTNPKANRQDCTVFTSDELLSNMTNKGGNGSSNADNCTMQAMQSRSVVSYAYCSIDHINPKTGLAERRTIYEMGLLRATQMGTTNAKNDIPAALADRCTFVNVMDSDVPGNNIRLAPGAFDNNSKIYEQFDKIWSAYYGLQAHFMGIVIASGALEYKPNVDVVEIFKTLVSRVPNARLLGLDNTARARSPGRFNQLLQQAVCMRVVLYIWRYGVLGPDPLSDYGRLVEFANAHWFVHTEDLAMWFCQYALNNDSNAAARELLCVFKEQMLQTKKCGRPVLRNSTYYQIKLSDEFSSNGTNSGTNMYNFDQQAVKIAMKFRSDEKLLHTIEALSNMTGTDNTPMIRTDKNTHQLFIYEKLVNYITCDGERRILRAHNNIITTLQSQEDAWLNDDGFWVITDPVEIARFGFPDPMIAGVDYRKTGDADYDDIDNVPLDVGVAFNESVPRRTMYAALLESNVTLGYTGIYINAEVSVPNIIALEGTQIGPDGPNYTRYKHALLYSKELLAFGDLDTTAGLMHGTLHELAKLRTAGSIAMLNSHPVLLTPPEDRTCAPVLIPNARYINKEFRDQSGMGPDNSRSLFKNDMPCMSWTGLKQGQSLDDALSNLMSQAAYGHDTPAEWLPSNLENRLLTSAIKAAPGHKLAVYTNFENDADDCIPVDAETLLFNA